MTSAAVPVERPVGELDPDRRPPASTHRARRSAACRAPAGRGRARSATPGLQGPRAGRRAGRPGRPAGRSRAAREVAVVARSGGRSSSAGPGQATLMPMPTTTGARARSATGPPGRPRPGPRPACARPATSRSFGHLRPAARPASASDRRRRRPGPPPRVDRWRLAGGRSGRSSTETSRFGPGGASQRRPSRPRPASGGRPPPPAPRVRPGGPRRAGSGWSSRWSSNRRTSVNRVPGHVARTLRGVPADVARTPRAVPVLYRLSTVPDRHPTSHAKGAAC